MDSRFIQTAQAMQALAKEWLADLVAARVILLQGDLGSGKTTFAQGIGQALGVNRPMTSPTFTLVNVYDLPEAIMGIRRFVHADLYRLPTVDRHSWQDLGLEEYTQELGALVCVEWPERLSFSSGGTRICFSVHDSDSREVTWQDSSV